MFEKIKKYVENSFILVFTFTFATTIIMLEIVKDGNILTDGRNEKIVNNSNILRDGRNERDYIRRERIFLLLKIKL